MCYKHRRQKLLYLTLRIKCSFRNKFKSLSLIFFVGQRLFPESGYCKIKGDPGVEDRSQSQVLAFHRWKDFPLNLFSPSPFPLPHNVGHMFTLFLQSFNIVLGEQRVLKRTTEIFKNSVIKTQQINAIT